MQKMSRYRLQFTVSGIEIAAGMALSVKFIEHFGYLAA
jgi:hypothetical protein